MLWGWAGTPIDEQALVDLGALSDTWMGVREQLEPLLTVSEIEATRRRLDALVRSGAYPDADGAWPALPWPAM